MESFMFAPVGKSKEGEGNADPLFARHHRKSIAAGVARSNALAHFPNHRALTLTFPSLYPALGAPRQSLHAPAQSKISAASKHARFPAKCRTARSEEHTSELQSPDHLVCRLLLEKKKKSISN